MPSFHVMQKKNVHVGPWPDLDMWTTSVPQRNINEKLSVSCKYICNEILLSVSYKTVQAPVQVPICLQLNPTLCWTEKLSAHMHNFPCGGSKYNADIVQDLI